MHSLFTRLKAQDVSISFLLLFLFIGAHVHGQQGAIKRGKESLVKAKEYLADAQALQQAAARAFTSLGNNYTENALYPLPLCVPFQKNMDPNNKNALYQMVLNE